MVTIGLNRNHETQFQQFLIATKARNQALKYVRPLTDFTPAKKKGGGGKGCIMIESSCVNPECLCRYQSLLNGTE